MSAACSACAALARVGQQCNTHRRTAPNRRTLVQAELLRRVRGGMTPAEAEASLGVTAGPQVGGQR